MNWQQLRFLTIGLGLGMLLAMSPSCGKKCDAKSCAAGCCSKDTCVTATSDAQCGTNGAACSACSSGTTCQEGACREPMMMNDGGTDGGEDAGVDAGPPPCAKDDDCAAQMNGTRCDQNSGLCIPATACNTAIGDSQCQTGDFNDYCYQFGVQCRCEADTGAPTGFDGVCRRRLGACDECTTDDQCGSSLVFDPPAKCFGPLMGDTSGKKYCLRVDPGGVNGCGCGFQQNTAGLCEPQSHDCSMVGCSADKDCPSGSVCNTGSCLCEARCRWDFDKQQVVPGCPPGKTCWVDEANMDPNSLYFGAGRCRPPCADDTDCTDTTKNPYGGPKLKCGSEQLMGGGMSDKRCRGNGECMDDLECPTQPVDSPYNGYCDRTSLSCQGMNCRTGTDPTSGVPYKDCRIPYACAADAGTNICRLLTCVEQGGAIIACRQGQYCCGEDKDGDGQADPCPDPAQRGPDNCYDAPVPPFCSTCQSQQDCQNLQLPAYLTGNGACVNGSKSPNCSTLPYVCVQETMNGSAVCAVPTWNDGTVVAASHTNRAALGCPVNFGVQYFRPNVAAQGSANYCDSDSDCNIGTDAGRCLPDTGLALPDGGHLKACMCTVGVPGTCPNDTSDGGMGPQSECRYGISGQTVPCITSIACLPNFTILVADAGPPKYGCGLTLP